MLRRVRQALDCSEFGFRWSYSDRHTLTVTLRPIALVSIAKCICQLIRPSACRVASASVSFFCCCRLRRWSARCPTSAGRAGDNLSCRPDGTATLRTEKTVSRTHAVANRAATRCAPRPPRCQPPPRWRRWRPPRRPSWPRFPPRPAFRSRRPLCGANAAARNRRRSWLSRNAGGGGGSAAIRFTGLVAGGAADGGGGA